MYAYALNFSISNPDLAPAHWCSFPQSNDTFQAIFPPTERAKVHSPEPTDETLLSINNVCYLSASARRAVFQDLAQRRLQATGVLGAPLFVRLCNDLA